MLVLKRSLPSSGLSLSAEQHRNSVLGGGKEEEEEEKALIQSVQQSLLGGELMVLQQQHTAMTLETAAEQQVSEGAPFIIKFWCFSLSIAYSSGNFFLLKKTPLRTRPGTVRAARCT